jgi:hypothetical protein
MWTRAFVLSKLQATAIHLGLSAVAFCVVLYFIVVEWYPQPWFSLDGGWQGVRIMIVVDLVLGPALTFIIFNAAKSRRALLFDFTMIGLTQLGAFTWGVYAVHGQRPVAISYFDGGFYSFEERALRWQGRTVADLSQLDSRVPPLVFAEVPKTHQERVSTTAAMQKYDIADFELFERLRPLKPNLDEVWGRSEALAEMLWADPKEAGRLQRILDAHPALQREDLRFVWFIGRYEEATLVMTAHGELLGSVRYVEPKKKPKPA